MSYLERSVEGVIKKASANFPVVMVTGPRQVGKTTCLRNISSKNRSYVSLDDPQLRSLAKEEPELFLQRFSPPVLIDEVQYAPELFPLIKLRVDEAGKKGEYWLTGSQQFQLMEGVSESLAGRVGIIQLLGLSNSEMDGRSGTTKPFWEDFSPNADISCQDLQSLYQRIFIGGMPGIVADSSMDRDMFFSSYLQTYLERDVRLLINVSDELSFLKFVRAIAARTGQILNIADVASDVGVAPNTAKNWLSILRSSGIVYLLEAYHSNVTKRLIKSPKVFMTDTGLASYLTEWSSPQTLEAGAMSGAILETWGVIEILKSYWHQGMRAPIYYYRDKDKREIDLLVIKDGGICPVEFKKSANPNKKDLKNFYVLENFNLERRRGFLVSMSKNVVPITQDIDAIPFGAL